MITENILVVNLEITAYTAYTGYKGKIEEDMFSEGYIYLIQPIYIRTQIRHAKEFAANILCCGSQKTWVLDLELAIDPLPQGEFCAL